MPYEWRTTPDGETLHAWPHQSLTPKGFVIFIGATAALFALPLLALVGSAALWALLPFLALAVWAVWTAINKNQRHRQIVEILTIATEARLMRHDAKGTPPREWQCNSYWVMPTLHETSGPVPNYVTLRGGAREVEIGAFLSEEERLDLYKDLRARLPQRNLADGP